MQGHKDGLDGLQRKPPKKSKAQANADAIAKANAKEEACVLLAIRLHADYAEAYGKSRGVEVERFAEEWIKQNAPDIGRRMERAAWGYFMNILTERRKDRDK